MGSKLLDFSIEKRLGKRDFDDVYLVCSKLTKKIYGLKETKGDYYNNNQRL